MTSTLPSSTDETPILAEGTGSKPIFIDKCQWALYALSDDQELSQQSVGKAL